MPVSEKLGAMSRELVAVVVVVVVVVVEAVPGPGGVGWSHRTLT